MLYRNGQLETIYLSAATEPALNVDGNISLDGNFFCNGMGRFCDQFGAPSMFTVTMQDNIIIDPENNPFKKQHFEEMEGHRDMGQTASSQVKQAATYIYQDAYITVNAFAFPPYNVLLSVVPGMMWQADNHDRKHIGRNWKEEPIVSVIGTTTMCYPGLQVWKNAKVSYRNNVKLTLIDGYVTNT